MYKEKEFTEMEVNGVQNLVRTGEASLEVQDQAYLWSMIPQEETLTDTTISPAATALWKLDKTTTVLASTCQDGQGGPLYKI